MLVLAGSFPIVACSGKSEPAKGELIVAFQTDMQVPEGISGIRVQVLQNGIYRFNVLYTVGPDGVKLPATLAVVAGEQNSPVTIQVVAYSDPAGKQAKVLRKATLTVPTSRVALLHMPIQWLCWDSTMSLKPGADPEQPEYDGMCADDETCIAGACQTKEIDASSLPSYTSDLVFGGAPLGKGGQCIDVQACFQKGVQVTPHNNSTDGKVTKCWLDLPPGATKDNLNVGLVLPPQNTKGVCDANDQNCIVTVENDPSLGFKVEGNEVILPNNVCERLGSTDDQTRVDAIAVTTACTSKTSQFPTCGPWSAVSVKLDDDGGTLDGSIGNDASDADTDASLDGGTDASSDADAAVIPQSQAVGMGCNADADCPNLKCVRQTGTLGTGSLGPAGGLCSWPCSVTNDICGKVKSGSVCQELAPGEGYCVEGCDPSKPFYDTDAGAAQCSGRLDMACKQASNGSGPGCMPRCSNDAACLQGLGGDGGVQSYCHLLDGMCHSTPESASNVGTACGTGDAGTGDAGTGDAGTCSASTCQSYDDGTGGKIESCSAECVLQDSALGGISCGWDGISNPKTICGWPADKTATLPGSAGQCMELCGCGGVQYFCENNPGFVCVDWASATWLDPGYLSFIQSSLPSFYADGFCAPPVGPNGETVTSGGGC